uniref:C-type lectin domain-containing protein n=1 Tax=Periophthalmus magnuspinnatus TaxID=409849 RepID=A0A3B4A387_9GOBI
GTEDWIILVQCRYYEYHYINLEKTWTDAQKYCRGYYTDLATIESAEDANRITLLVNWAWIGLTDDPASWRRVLTVDSNSWKWSATETTSPGGYQNFANLEPNNYNAAEWCVFVDGQSGWKDYYCSNKLHFFLLPFTG